MFISALPYRVAYIVIIITLCFFIMRSALTSIENHENEVKEAKREVERCFIKYNEEKCDSKNDATMECRTLLECVKNRNVSRGLFKTALEVFGN